MIQIINGEIKGYELPKYMITKTGETILNYHLQDKQTLKEDGWLSLEENIPTYNPEAEYLQFERYEILEDKVIKHYIATSIEKTHEEILEEQIKDLQVKNEKLQVEMARSNAELFETMIMFVGGM